MNVVLGLDDTTIEQISAVLIKAKTDVKFSRLQAVEAWRRDKRSNDASFQAALTAKSKLFH